MAPNYALERSVKGFQECAADARNNLRPRRLVRLCRGPLNAGVRRQMRKAIAACTAILVVAPCVADDWRLASVEEIEASWGGDGLGSIPINQVLADFDGNGVADAARILRSESTGELFLFVALNEGTPNYRLLQLRQMDGLGIELIRPGIHKTLCGKGYECPEGGPTEVTLKWPGLGVFKPASASWVMYWDVDEKIFKEFGTSD